MRGLLYGIHFSSTVIVCWRKWSLSNLDKNALNLLHIFVFNWYGTHVSFPCTFFSYFMQYDVISFMTNSWTVCFESAPFSANNRSLSTSTGFQILYLATRIMAFVIFSKLIKHQISNLKLVHIFPFHSYRVHLTFSKFNNKHSIY